MPQIVQNAMLVTTRRCADFEIRPKSKTSTRVVIRSVASAARVFVCLLPRGVVRTAAQRRAGLLKYSRVLLGYSRVLLGYSRVLLGCSRVLLEYSRVPVLRSGVRYFFSSFFFRDEAYKQLVSFWQQARASRGKGGKIMGTENWNKGTENWNKGTENRRQKGSTLKLKPETEDRT